MIPTGGVSQLSGCCPPYGYHFTKPLAFLKLELTPSLFSYSLCEKAKYKSQSYLRTLRFVDEGIFNCCLYLTITRREQCNSNSSSFFRI